MTQEVLASVAAVVPGDSAPTVEGTQAHRHEGTQPEWLPTRLAAAALGVSDQSLLNYKAAGMRSWRKVDADTPAGARGGFEFHLGRCRDWIKKNRPVTGTGGKRPGSGRKPGWKTGKQELPGALPGRDAADSPLVRSSMAEPDELANPEMDAALNRLTEGTAAGADMRLLCGIVASRSLSRADADLLEQLSTTNERNRKAAEARRSLVNADEVKQEWTENLKQLRVRVSGLVARCAARVMASGQVSGDREPMIRAALSEEIEAVVVEMGRG